MTITATFSNGYTDTYKGKRSVTAAWAIIRKSDGEVLMSGHSLDRAKAAKTANGNVRYLGHEVGVDLPSFDVPQRIIAGHNYSYLGRAARAHGWEGKGMADYKRWAAAKNAERRAAIEAAVRVEIVDV